MKPIDALKFMFYLFCMVTTFETLFIAALGLFDPDITFAARELFKIPLVALLSALPVMILIRSETASRTEWLIRKALHFTLTAGIVFGMLIYFDWLDKKNAPFVILFFLILYAAAFVIHEIRAKQLADELNKRIDAFHQGESAQNRSAL
jgi:hypothetical protein